MKRILTFLLAAVMAVSLWGCGKKAATPETTQPTEAQIPETSLSFGVQYIRTSRNTWDQSYPGVHVVDSREALDAYYDANKSIYDLERSEKTYFDTTIGFLNACDKYDDAFFAQSYLIFLVLHEGSSSTEHYVHKILQNSQGQTEIWVQSVLPGGLGNDAEQQWHVLLELERTESVPTTKEIAVYLDDQLAYEYGHVLEPMQKAKYPTPPRCVLVTPAGKIGLEAVGYNWNESQPDKTVRSTTTCLSSRPIAQEHMVQVFIDNQYAQPIPEAYLGGSAQNTGYFLQLDWPVTPRDVAITCWPESSNQAQSIIHSDSIFHAPEGSFLYEIQVSWPNTGLGYWGSATYYVYITDQAEADTQMQDTPLSYDVQFIRTGGYFEQEQYPQVQIIDSREALDTYYEANKTPYVLEHTEFLDACEEYDSAFFTENYLIFLVLQEGSGSVRHKVHSVAQDGKGQLAISVESVLPGGVGTSDMAQWHILLVLERPEELPTAKDVLVYWNDRLAFEKGEAIRVIPGAQFQGPPACELRSQSGDLSLKAVNYSWNAQQSDGTVLNTITDLAMRPVSPEGVTWQMYIDPKHAETIYGLVESTGVYEPTNSLGYFVKLYWPANPTTVKITCWAPGESVERVVFLCDNSGFYAWQGSYIYEIQATWEDEAQGFWGNATYYVYITDKEPVTNGT